MPSAWKAHLTAYRAAHPQANLKECMQGASKTYRSVVDSTLWSNKHAKLYKLTSIRTAEETDATIQESQFLNYCFETLNASVNSNEQNAEIIKNAETGFIIFMTSYEDKQNLTQMAFCKGEEGFLLKRTGLDFYKIADHMGNSI